MLVHMRVAVNFRQIHWIESYSTQPYFQSSVSALWPTDQLANMFHHRLSRSICALAGEEACHFTYVLTCIALLRRSTIPISMHYTSPARYHCPDCWLPGWAVLYLPGATACVRLHESAPSSLQAKKSWTMQPVHALTFCARY